MALFIGKKPAPQPTSATRYPDELFDDDLADIAPNGLPVGFPDQWQLELADEEPPPSPGSMSSPGSVTRSTRRPLPVSDIQAVQPHRTALEPQRRGRTSVMTVKPPVTAHRSIPLASHPEPGEESEEEVTCDTLTEKKVMVNVKMRRELHSRLKHAAVSNQTSIIGIIEGLVEQHVSEWP